MFTVKNLSALMCAATLTACGSYQKDTYLKDIQQDVSNRTSYAIDRLENNSPIQPLSGVLTHKQVIEAALRYNANLQASLEDLNVATANEIQAGLLINPTFQGEFVFTGNGARPILDLMLALDVSRIVTRSNRVTIAKRKREAVFAQVTSEIVQTIAQAQSALLRLWHAEAMLGLYEEQVTIAAAGAKTAQLLFEAGNIVEGALAEYYNMHDIMLVNKTRASLMVLDARESLAAITGTPLSSDVHAATNVNAVKPIHDKDGFIERVMNQNLHLSAERQNLEALGAKYDLAKISAWIEHLELEAVYEREEDGSSEGFSVTLPIPIFDWGQVRTGQAQAMLDSASYRYKAMLINVSNRAEKLFRYTQSLSAVADRMTGTYIENADKAYAFEQSQLNAMQIGPLSLLKARDSLIRKQMQTLDIQYQYALASITAHAMETGVILNNADEMQGAGMAGNMMKISEGGH